MDNKQDITVDKFDMVCRTCLCLFQAPYQCYSILNGLVTNKVVSEVLEFHAKISVEENDDLPQNICSDCFEDLTYLCKFLKRCRTADRLLRKVVITTKLPTKVDSTESGPVVKPVPAVKEEIIKIKVENDTDFISNMAPGVEYAIDKVGQNEDDDEPVNDGQLTEGEDTNTDSLDFAIQNASEEDDQTYFVCTICQEGYTNNKDLELHLRTHIIKPAEEKIKQADAIMLEVMGEVMNEPSDETEGNVEDRTCKVCGKVFTTPLGLECHLPIHDAKTKKKKKYDDDDISNRMCLVCNKVFATRLGLQSHKVRHQEKSFSCEKCGYKFHTKAGLEIHYRSHSGEKPYKCSYCSKAFSQQGSLTLHTLTHTGERPHKCHLCTAAFKQGHHLQYHLQSHSGEKPYTCTICEKGFASKRNLIIHSRSHTGEREYICPICSKGFYDRHGVNKHIKRHVFGHPKGKANPLDTDTVIVADDYATLDKLLFKGRTN